MSRHETTDFDRARDELMSQIHRCGVLSATPDQRDEWLKDTTDYLATEFPSLSEQQLADLQQIGVSFCQPAIPHGRGKTDLTRDEWEKETEAESADDFTASREA